MLTIPEGLLGSLRAPARLLALILSLCFPVCAPGADGPSSQPANIGPPSRDSYGDPLPRGAVARFGTVRWRHADEVMCLAASPDGKLIASGGKDWCIRLWDAATGKEVRRIEAPAGFTDPEWDPISIVSLDFSPDGKTLVSGANDTTVRLWDLVTGKELRCLRGHKVRLCAVRFSPDGKLLASGDRDGTLHLWDARTGKELRQLQGERRVGSSPAFSPDGKTIAAGLSRPDHGIMFWDPATGEELRHIGAHAGEVHGLAFSPDGRLLASGGDGAVRLWEPSTGREVRRIEGEHGKCNVVAFSSDGKTLVAGCEDHTVRRWDVGTGQAGAVLGARRRLPPRENRLEGAGVRAVVFSADGKTLASTAAEPTVHVWDLATGRDSTPGHGEAPRLLAFALDGKSLFSGGDDGTLRRWDVTTAKELLRLPTGTPGSAWEHALSPGCDRVAFGNPTDRVIRLCDPATGRELRRLSDQRVRGPFRVAFSPDGRTLASSDHEGSVSLWDTATGKQIRQIDDGSDTPKLIDFSPDGKLLAVASGRGTLSLWNVSTGQRVREFPHFGDPDHPKETGFAYYLAYSPDGRSVATGGGYRNSYLRLWDVETGKKRWAVEQVDLYLWCLAFSPDGRSLAAGTDNGPCRLWEVATGRERAKFVGHASYVMQVTFSPDGRALASGSADATILLWDVFDLLGQRKTDRPNRGEKELDQLWSRLSEADAFRAFLALKALLATPDASLRLLTNHLKPVPRETPASVRQLVADLDDEAFAVRQKAEEELEKLGPLAESAVRQALADRPSTEARRRLEALLSKVGVPTGARRLQWLRAVEVLGLIDSPEARKVLAGLAEGSPHSWLTREARASLECLGKRPGAAR
jgi:WD40 repeat protein